MTINQIVSEQMKEFDEKFPVGKYGITNVLVDALKFHIKMFSRKLIESVAEEIINRLEEDVKTVIESDVVKEGNAINECISGVFGNERLKVKEIISQIQK